MVHDNLEALHERLEAELPDAVRLRQHLHARPDRSGEEQRTRDVVLSALPRGGSAQPVADTGAVVRIGGPGPAVAVRAELDALPVHFDFADGEDQAVLSSTRRVSARDRYDVKVPGGLVDGRLAAAMAVALDALQDR